VPAQQKAAGAAFAVKRGDARVSDLAEGLPQHARQHHRGEREDLASAKRRDLPERRAARSPQPGKHLRQFVVQRRPLPGAEEGADLDLPVAARA
jgi:hypothetical protein